jgi:tetratricopeptide (TPR) repeat protein
LAERVLLAATGQGSDDLAAVDRQLQEAETAWAESQLIRGYFAADYLTLLQRASRAQQAEKAAKEAAERMAQEAADRAAREETERAAQRAAEEASEQEAARLAARQAQVAKVAEADRHAREVKAAKVAKAKTHPGDKSRRKAEKGHPVRHRRPRALNLKLVVILLSTAASLTLGVFLLHAFQVGRTAASMLSRARQAERKGDLSEAIRRYNSYVNYVPDDDEAYAKLALLTADQAQSAGGNPQALIQAYRMLERAAIRQRENLGVIRRLADISMKVGQTQTAQEHLKRLMQAFPKESDLEVKLGRCQVAGEHKREAIGSFQRVIARDPGNLDAYVELAKLYRGLDDVDQAEATLGQMISVNSTSAKAYLERGRLRRENDQKAEGKKDILRALEMSPEDVDVLVAAAEVALDEKDFELARTRLNLARQKAPDEERVHRTLALLSVNAGNTDEAIGHLQTAVQKVADNPIAIISLADLQLKKGDLVAVRQSVKMMRKAAFREEVLEYFEAQILVAEGKWWEASGVLERLRAKVMGWPEFRSRVELFLGACYEQLKLPDRQLDMYQRVLAEDPAMIPARVGFAAALFAAGNYDKAKEEYQKLEETMGSAEFLKTPAIRSNVFQLIVARIEQLPQKDRDWSELEQYLDKLEKVKDVDPVQRTLMRAELLVKTGKTSEARELVDRLGKERPREATLWAALAKVTALEKKPEEGLRVLDEAAAHVKDSLILRLSRVDMAVLVGGEPGKAALAAAEANADALSEPEKVRLWQVLAGAYYRLRDRQQAEQLWKRVADAQSRDVQTLLTLFALACESQEETAINEALERVRKVLGSRSAEANYCEAARIVWASRTDKAEAKNLDRAKQLLAVAAQERPGWFEIPRLEAEIALQEGLDDEAIERFQRASELGSLSPLHLGQLVQLLYRRGRYEEAKQVMAKLARWESVLNLRKLEAELNLLSGNFDQALQMAQETVSNSKQAADFLWYAQLLARAKKYEEARKMCRQALELDPRIPEAWLGLVALLIDAGKKDEAKQALQQAQSRLPEDRTPLVLAQGYQMLGDLAQAEQHYQQAVGFDPENLTVIQNAARFYLQTGRNHQARKYLEQILRLAGREPEKHLEPLTWSRRALARVLAGVEDYRQFQQAVKLLDENARGGKLPLEDLRLKAGMLASRPERSFRQRAIALLLEIREKRRQTLTPREQLTLAQLYENTNQWEKCQDEMLDLLAVHADRPEVLAAYIQMLLRNNESSGGIANWIDKLEKLQPEAPVTLGVKARLLVKEGKAEAAVKLLGTLIPRPLPPEQVTRLRDVAGLLEDLKQYDEARRLLDEFAASSPDARLVLAAYLGRRGELDEALNQCEKSLSQDAPALSVLTAAVGILEGQLGKASPSHFQRVDAWFQRALREEPNSKVVQWQRAAFRQLYAPREEMVRLYREFLKRPDLSEMEKAVVWNNLAFMLATGGRESQEALEMINRAIEIMGPSANLLDTRAIIYLSLEQPEQAIADLRQAIAESPSGIAYFHLALAHQAAKDPDAAGRAFQTARDSHQLTPDQIPFVERERYQQLVVSLGRR